MVNTTTGLELTIFHADDEAKFVADCREYPIKFVGQLRTKLVPEVRAVKTGVMGAGREILNMRGFTFLDH